MKKVLFLTVLVLGSLFLTVNYVSAKSYYVIEFQNNNGWQELGKIEIWWVTNYSEPTSLSATLYVKSIGLKTFYKVIRNDEEYAIVFGNYEVRGKKYNAKAGKYYLNMQQ